MSHAYSDIRKKAYDLTTETLEGIAEIILELEEENERLREKVEEMEPQS